MLAHDDDRDDNASGGGGRDVKGSVTYDEVDPNHTAEPGQNNIYAAMQDDGNTEEIFDDMDQSTDDSSDRDPLVDDVVETLVVSQSGC